MEKLIWHTEKRKIGELIPTEGNPRQMTEKQAEDLKKSLKKFNLVEIPAINLDNRIISGHQRIILLKLDGKQGEEIDVRVPNRQLTEEEHWEYLLRANKNLGEWNFEELANFNEDMLKDVGFESDELDEIFGLKTNEDDFDAEEEYEKIKEPLVKLGDLYQLGNHRLLCGDSTKKKDVEKLMGGEKADISFCDPPYNIGYDYWDFLDKKETKEYREWCELWFRELIKFVPIIILTIGKWNLKMWYNIERPLGTAIWIARNKTSGSRISLFSIWEPILIYAKKIKRRKIPNDILTGDLKILDEEVIKNVETAKRFIVENSDIFEINNIRQKDVGGHSCPKQLNLMKEILERYSERNQIVLDLFGGSGSTLIACEQLNRKCYMMEIDEKYCQVIIDRFEKFTNQKATKL